MLPTPRPAPARLRVFAALLDGLVLLGAMALSFVVPLVTWGFALPMWGVLLVVLGFSVVPLSLFSATLGLKLMGLEVVNRHARPLDPANATFRELLARGALPAAYLFTLVAGLVAQHFGVAANLAPPVLAGVMTVACALALVAALIGPVVALGRDDGRTLADLLSGSFVVLAPARPPPEDPDDVEAAREARRRAWVRFGVLELALLGALVGLPALLTVKSHETTAEKIDRLRLEKLRAQFAAHPEDATLTRQLSAALAEAGRDDERQQVQRRHLDALAVLQQAREAGLRQTFSATHRREDAAALIELLETQERVDEAEAVYRELLGPSPEAGALVGFANWLAAWNRNTSAAEAARRATELDPTTPLAHTVLGAALLRLGDLPHAQEALELALLQDAADEDARDALDVVEETLGPLDPAGRAVLQRRVARWRADAGN